MDRRYASIKTCDPQELESSTKMATGMAAFADLIPTGQQLIESSDLPSPVKTIVSGKREPTPETPGKTPLTTMEEAAAGIEKSPYGSGTIEYISNDVPPSPTEDDKRRKLRPRNSLNKPKLWRPPRAEVTPKPPRKGPPPRRPATQPAWVLPDPITTSDIESETESTPASSPGRPARSTTTDRA
jgi:hypothetical protein